MMLGLLGCQGSDVDTDTPPATGEDTAASSALDSQGGLPGVSLGVGGGSEDVSTSEPLPPESPDVVEQPPVAQSPAGDPEPSAQAEMERVKAEAGVALKGQSLAEHEGVLVTPAKALFSAQQRLIYDAAVPKALQLYEATNQRYPQTHEEFMNDVIKANQIQLPPLPPGQKYVYDVEARELMVERPR
jgi:hypothetical protein